MPNFVFAVLSTLVVLVPFVFSPKSSELFEFPKLLLIYFGASLLFPLLWAKKRYQTGSMSRNSQIVIAASIFFLFTQIISTLFSVDKHVSLFGYYSRFNGGLVSLISYLTLMTIAWKYLSMQKIEALLKVILLTGIGVALWGLPSHFGADFICLAVLGQFNNNCWTADFIPEKRMFATLGQPNWFATYLLLLIMISLYYFFTGQGLLNKKLKQYNPYLNIFIFGLFSLELFWTNSKSGLITYIVFVSGYFGSEYILNRKKTTILLRNFFLLPLIILCLFSFLTLFPYFSRLTSRILVKPTITTSQNNNLSKNQATDHITPSSDIRLIVWEGAWKLAQKYPLFGTGPETFAYSYYFTRPIAHNLTSEWNFVYNKAHNELLNYLATTGFLGLSAYLLMFVAFMLPAVYLLVSKEPEPTEKKRFAIFYMITMLSLFTMNIFGFSTTATSLFFYLLPALVLVVIENKTDLEEQTNESPIKEVSVAHLGLYFVWLLFAFIYLLNYFSADYNYARGREYKQIQDFNNAYLFTEKALSLRVEPTYLDQQAAVAANLAALLKIQKANPQTKELVQKAIDDNRLSLRGSPQNVFYYKTQAKIYYLLSLINLDSTSQGTEYLSSSVKALEKAHELAPTDPVIPYTLASLLTQREPARAESLLKEALTLKPDYNEAKELIKHLQKTQ